MQVFHPLVVALVTCLALYVVGDVHPHARRWVAERRAALRRRRPPV